MARRNVALVPGRALTLPEFEAQWRDWLLGRATAPGLAQRLVPAAPTQVADPEALRALEALKDTRARALQHLGVYYEEVELDPQLSSQAQAHAAYLELNEDQQSAWPDAHEEYPDREGFSAEGAWAGLHGVIDFHGDPVLAVESWMGTFFHRLPLLEPGLFGVGYGRSAEVVVLDIGSLIAPCWEKIWVAWPPPDARDVPRSFTPELPNPVPGEDQSAWGYPITVQAYWAGEEGEHDFEIRLYEGSGTGGDPVPGHLLTPTAPKNDRLSPDHAFCFIPLKKLSAAQTYTVWARCSSPERVEQWRFETAR